MTTCRNGDIGNRESGTYFIAYSATLDITGNVLRQICSHDPPGNHDRLLDFTHCGDVEAQFATTVEFPDTPNSPVSRYRYTARTPPSRPTVTTGSLSLITTD